MKKPLLFFISLFAMQFAGAQNYYEFIKNGKLHFNEKSYDAAYTDFFKAERLVNKEEDLTSIELGELYYFLGRSLYLSDSSKIIRIESYLVKAVGEGNSNAFKMLAFDVPQLHPQHFKLLTAIYFKDMTPQELNYCKALICAKMSKNLGNEMAFSYLEKALEKGFRDNDLFTNKTIRQINPEKYFHMLKKYKTIPSQYNYLVKLYVETRINQWQRKGKFEKTTAYQQRVSEESRKRKIKEFAKYYMDSIGMTKYNFALASNRYDADNEIFLISFADNKSIYLHVPLSEAPAFDSNFKKLQFQNSQFTIYNDDFELVHLEIVNPQNHKTYTYDSKEVATFNSELIDYQFEAINISTLDIHALPQEQAKPESHLIDVEQDIPVAGVQNKNIFALIIGNEDYQSYQTGLKKEQNVEFAVRDAHIFKEYCLQTLGIPKENILFYTNAGTVTMNQAITQINQVIKTLDGDAEILVYYAGHGYPDAKSEEPCLIPVDVNSASMQFAIPLDKMLASLSEYPSKKVVLFLDACFSGGGRDMGLMASRGVKIIPKSAPISGNIVVFSASDKEQSALPYEEQKHGLFTYFLLKKLKETKGNVTLSELDDYLSKQVAIKASLVNKQEQTPKTHFSPNVKDQWRNWQLK